MIGLKVRSRDAEKARKYLVQRKLMDYRYMVIRSQDFIYFPILSPDGGNARNKTLKGLGEVVRKSFTLSNAHRPSYRELLKSELGKEYEDAVKGFDMLGTIAIIDSPAKNARAVARAVMESNSNVETVLRKTGAVKGAYRIRGYAYVAGKRTYVTTYKENGVVLRFDVRKSFFSNRLSFERGRIAALSKGKENVLVMFAGVGPFAIEIAKKNPKAKVVGIELNSSACKDMRDNILLNKVRNVSAICADVKKEAKKHPRFADRIVMPLPKDAHEFLDSVIACAKPRCTVHYYSFVPSEGGTEASISQLSKFFAEKGWKFKVLMVRTVRPYAPDTIEIVVDFEIQKR